jgi:hypothetical protein
MADFLQLQPVVPDRANEATHVPVNPGQVIDDVLAHF